MDMAFLDYAGVSKLQMHLKLPARLQGFYNVTADVSAKALFRLIRSNKAEETKTEALYTEEHPAIDFHFYHVNVFTIYSYLWSLVLQLVFHTWLLGLALADCYTAAHSFTSKNHQSRHLNDIAVQKIQEKNSCMQEAKHCSPLSKSKISYNPKYLLSLPIVFRYDAE